MTFKVSQVSRFHKVSSYNASRSVAARVSRENTFGYLPHLRKLGEEKNIDAIFLKHRTSETRNFVAVTFVPLLRSPPFIIFCLTSLFNDSIHSDSRNNSSLRDP